MMQRVSGSAHQVHTLSSALAARQGTGAAVEAEVQMIAPDPALELERLRTEVINAAREEGFRSGMEGAEQAVAQAKATAEQAIRAANQALADDLSARIAEVEALLGEIPQAIESHRAQLESALVEIAYASVLRILGELHVEGDLVARICQDVLREYRQRPATLYVSPTDLPVLENLIESQELKVESDVAQRKGQLRLESINGAHEAGLQSRLEHLLQAFIDSLPTRGH